MIYGIKRPLFIISVGITFIIITLGGFVIFYAEQHSSACPKEPLSRKKISFTFVNPETKEVSRSEIFADRIVITFREGTTKTDIDQLVVSVNGCIKEVIAPLNAYLVQIPDAANELELKRVIDFLQSHPSIKSVEPETLLEYL